MSSRHLICLVVDGLRASALGTYGNTIYPTPQLDALASRSVVADWMWADSPRLEDFYRSAWQGEHSLRPPASQESVIHQLQLQKVWQGLITDDPWVTDQADAMPFDDTLSLEHSTETSAETVEGTTLGQFFADVVQWLPQWRQDADGTNSLLWLHSLGMYGPWDAPVGMRADLLEDEELEVPEFVQPPELLQGIDDPDVLLQYRIAYATQVAVLDTCVGALRAAIEETHSEDETLLLLASSRGLALGEHDFIGTDCDELYGERLHLPWLIYPCGNGTPLPRLTSMSSPCDIAATVLDWLGAEPTDRLSDGISCRPVLSGGSCAQRQLGVSASPTGQAVVRTPAWMLHESDCGEDDVDSVELFTKPDDRWEYNNVAGLCAEIVEQLRAERTEYERCCREGAPLPLVPREGHLLQPNR